MPTVYVPLDRVIDNPFQTRSHYDPEAVAELADSIERDGQLQTPVARMVEIQAAGLVRIRDARHATSDQVLAMLEVEADLSVQLAYGHTRARACRAIWDRRAGDLVAGAGIHGCPVGCMPVELRPLTDDAMERLAWEENERRRDLDPVDRAAAIAARIARHGWTHEEAGEALGLDRSTVSNILRWYEPFHAGPFRGVGHHVLAAMRRGEFSESRARALAGAFVAAAEDRAAYRRAVQADDDVSLGHLWAVAKRLGTAAEVRELVGDFTGFLESEAEAERKRREPEMFDDAPEARTKESIASTKPASATPPATPPPTSEPDANLHEPPFGADEDGEPLTEAEMEARLEADGYDDGGAGLRRAAEALDMEPFDQADGATEAAGLGEAAGEDDTWPQPQLPEEWDDVDGMTIKQLEETRARYALHGFIRLDKHHVGEDRRKPAQQVHTRAVLRAVANLRAAVQLTDTQLDEVLDHLGDSWMKWSTSPANERLREVAPMPDAHWRRHLRTMVLPTLVKRYDEIARAMGKLPEHTPDVSADTPKGEAGPRAGVQEEELDEVVPGAGGAAPGGDGPGGRGPAYDEPKAAGALARATSGASAGPPGAEPSGPIGEAGVTAPGGGSAPSEGSAGGEDNGDEPNDAGADADRAVWDALTPPARRLLVDAARGTSDGARSESGCPVSDAGAADELVRAALAFRSGGRLCARSWGGQLAERFGAETARLDEPAEAEVPA